MTPERLQEIVYARNKYGSANCWTGETGTLAAMIDELLKECESHKANLDTCIKVLGGILELACSKLEALEGKQA